MLEMFQQPDGLWTVTLDRSPVMSDDSYTVASNIVYGNSGNSECEEIRRALVGLYRQKRGRVEFGS